MHGRAVSLFTRHSSKSVAYGALAPVSGLLLGMLAVFAPSPTQAQVLIALLLGDKVSNDRFQLGLHVSFAMTGLWGLSYDVRPTWALSLYGEIALSEHFRLQPELGMRYPGGARGMRPGIPGYAIDPLDDPIYDDVALDGTLERDMRYISLPVFAKWVVAPVAFGLGPQLSILHTANDRVSQSVDGTKVSIEDNVEGRLRRVDFGFTGSVEYAFLPQRGMRSFRLRVRGYLGLMDTVEDNPDKAVRNWNVMFGIDIPIGGPKRANNENRPHPS